MNEWRLAVSGVTFFIAIAILLSAASKSIMPSRMHLKIELDVYGMERMENEQLIEARAKAGKY